MSLTADDIIDRRRLRRKLSFWRIATFVILGLALLAMIGFAASKSGLAGAQKAHIAKVRIAGVITNDEPMLKLLSDLEKNENVKGVVLNISSPGGTTVGGEAMFEAIRNLAETKPVASNVGSLAASAGYMVASASDHIVARRSSIVGSIGVLFQYADASELLDKIGVKVNAVKSSPMKAEPNPFNAASDESLEMIDRLIQDSYRWFVDIVAERRQMKEQEVLLLADGSIFTGSQSLENGLIDAIGGQDKAVEWLKEERDLADDLEVVEHKPKRPGDNLFGNPAALHTVLRALGIEVESTDAAALEQAIRERLLLDGLVSIWQGSR